MRIMIDGYTWVTYSFRSPYVCAHRAVDTSVISVRTWASQLPHHDCVSWARVVGRRVPRVSLISLQNLTIVSYDSSLSVRSYAVLIVHSSTDSFRFFRHCISCVVIVPTVGFVLLCAVDFALPCTVNSIHSSADDHFLATAVDYGLSSAVDYTLSFSCRVLRVIFFNSLSHELWLSLHVLIVIQTSSCESPILSWMIWVCFLPDRVYLDSHVEKGSEYLRVFVF